MISTSTTPPENHHKRPDQFLLYSTPSHITCHTLATILIGQRHVAFNLHHHIRIYMPEGLPKLIAPDRNCFVDHRPRRLPQAVLSASFRPAVAYPASIFVQAAALHAHQVTVFLNPRIHVSSHTATLLPRVCSFVV
jgi:hypothetical protein